MHQAATYLKYFISDAHTQNSWNIVIVKRSEDTHIQNSWDVVIKNDLKPDLKIDWNSQAENRQKEPPQLQINFKTESILH